MSSNIFWQNTPTKKIWQGRICLTTQKGLFEAFGSHDLAVGRPSQGAAIVCGQLPNSRHSTVESQPCASNSQPCLALSHSTVPCTAPQTRASSAPEAKSIIKPMQVGALQNPQVEPIWGRALPMRDCWRMMWMCLNFQIFQGRHSGIVCGLSLPRIVTFLSNLWVRRDIPGDGGSGGMSSSDLVSPEPRSRGRW